MPNVSGRALSGACTLLARSGASSCLSASSAQRGPLRTSSLLRRCMMTAVVACTRVVAAAAHAVA